MKNIKPGNKELHGLKGEPITERPPKPKSQHILNEKRIDIIEMAYCIMRDLLIEMKRFGDLEGYDVDDIFELISKIDGN